MTDLPLRLPKFALSFLVVPLLFLLTVFVVVVLFFFQVLQISDPLISFQFLCGLSLV